MVDYSPLWDTMRKRGITQYMMLQDKILDNHTLNRYYIGTHLHLSGLYAE